MNIVHAIVYCIALAAVSIAAAFLIHGKDFEHPPKIIYWTGEVKQGLSLMEEDVTEQLALVWYHGGWPAFAWLRRH